MTRTVEAQNDVPLPLAIMALVGFAFVYLYLAHLRHHPETIEFALKQMELNAELFWISVSCVMVNVAFISIYLKRSIGLERQGSKLAILEGRNRRVSFGRSDVVSILTGITIYCLARKQIADFVVPIMSRLVPGIETSWVVVALSTNVALAVSLITRSVLRALAKMKFSFSDSDILELPEVEAGELVLGTTPGDLSHSTIEKTGEKEKWVKIPSRGVSGGIFISGSVGSGKTQGSILRYLPQILRSKGGCPAMLVIDPKRTFLANAEKIIKREGLGDKIVKISLRGNVSFNPVYAENP
ncbi:MAG: hypothetical protein AB7H97_14935, partial [Pseudobdellovibrionaceae bacterium]